MWNGHCYLEGDRSNLKCTNTEMSICDLPLNQAQNQSLEDESATQLPMLLTNGLVLW